MQEKPAVSPGEWIRVGERDALVCQVYKEPPSQAGGDLEVVFLDDRNRAINDDVVWCGASWAFVKKGDMGGYADNYTRLAHFVAILRGGRRE